MPGLTLGDTIPNVEADSTIGHLKLYDYVGDNWAIIFSHPGMVVLPSANSYNSKIPEYISLLSAKNCCWIHSIFFSSCLNWMKKWESRG